MTINLNLAQDTQICRLMLTASKEQVTRLGLSAGTLIRYRLSTLNVHAIFGIVIGKHMCVFFS